MGSKGGFVLLGLLLILFALCHSGECPKNEDWTIDASLAMRFLFLRPQGDRADAAVLSLALLLLPSSITGLGLCDNSFLR